jgi:tetratricopeptide (TPR) repeat protein
MKRHLGWLVVALSVFLAAGCAPKKITPLSDEDNPAHHYLMGMGMIEKGQIDEAGARFDRAVKLDPDYAPAIGGLALVAAIRTEAESDKEHRAVELERAVDKLDKALDKARGDSQKFDGMVTGIRVWTHARPKNWIEKAEKYHRKAMKLDNVKAEELPYYKGKEAAHYFMGVAYFKAFKFREAEGALGDVLALTPGKWHEPANKLYKQVQKINRASANYTLTDVGKKIAVKGQVVRGDVAALLVDEIHLDKVMAGRIPAPAGAQKIEFIPADVVNHLFKEEIVTALKWRVRGLEPIYDQISKAFLFYPEKPVTRLELAFVLEDLMMKISGDDKLATKYIGQGTSPYPDVATTAAWFNAVMTAVTRGLMEPELSGAFRPHDVADGAELLLAVMRLRNVMNIN